MPVDVTKYDKEMTAEQFAEHLRRVAWGLAYLERRLPVKYNEVASQIAPIQAKIAQTQANDMAFGISAVLVRGLQAQIAPLVAQKTKLGQALGTVTAASMATSVLLGPDWKSFTVEAAIDPKGGTPNAATFVRRMQAKPPAMSQAWYAQTGDALKKGYAAMDERLNTQLELANQELAFWETVLAIASVPGQVIKFVANTAAGGAGEFLKTLLEALKPLLVPVVALGGLYVGYKVWQNRKQAPTGDFHACGTIGGKHPTEFVR